MKNLVTLIGNIGEDPVTRVAQSGSRIVSFSLATSRPRFDRDGKPIRDEQGRKVMDTEWHRIVCFNGLGKSVESICVKGQKVFVQGRIHYTRWTDSEGVERFGCEIIADEVLFLSRGREQPKGDQSPGNTAVDDFEDDIPF